MSASEPNERRELAHRTNDGIEVTLFWSKPSNRVTIAVLNLHSYEILEFDVQGDAALDAFNHPYAYAYSRSARHVATTNVVAGPVKAATDR